MEKKYEYRMVVVVNDDATADSLEDMAMKISKSLHTNANGVRVQAYLYPKRMEVTYAENTAAGKQPVSFDPTNPATASVSVKTAVMQDGPVVDDKNT